MKRLLLVCCVLLLGICDCQLSAGISLELSTDGKFKTFVFESNKSVQVPKKVAVEEEIPMIGEGLEIGILRKIDQETKFLVERGNVTDVQKYENSHVRSSLKLFDSSGKLVWQIQRNFIGDFLVCRDGRTIFVEESIASRSEKNVALVVLDRQKKEVFRHSNDSVGRGFKLGSLQTNQDEDEVLAWTNGEIMLFNLRKNTAHSVENVILGKSSSAYAYRASFFENGVAIKWTRLFEDGRSDELETFYDMEFNPIK